ncbi:MAG TPA: sugar transferase [Gemmataceae bacterium]|jgi:lipopolysaccharide/colanic/teichoic acid biosynthesis glycosyltransferase|nr:sugar transferase [Gemmataceae bacterium]
MPWDYDYDSDRSEFVPPALPGHAVAGQGDWAVYPACRAAAEFAVALVLLVLSAPVMVLAAALVRLTSPGRAFYSQSRLGRGGRVYTIYKIRSMYHDCEKLSGPRWASKRDSRITPVGRFLRATHLDELPQLINVLRGEMSLIGPRPERPEFVPKLARAIPRYEERLRVRPGVTGFAQVQLPADTDLESVRRKLQYDLYYIDAMNLRLDLCILLSTALKVVGVPADFMRRLFALPSEEEVEEYHRVATLLPEPQPA